MVVFSASASTARQHDNGTKAMTQVTSVRPVTPDDYPRWRPLWDGYNAFYGRQGGTALDERITQTTWQRLCNPLEPLFALVAERDGELVGLTHFLYHASTTRLEPVCYLSDLFTIPALRGQGVGRALIEGVYERARCSGIREVYWQTHEANAAGRLLYEKLARHDGFIIYEQTV
jgi:GNAT superfamily N-acetyltransferase